MSDTADSHLLVVTSRCNAPAQAEEWSRWYDDEHLPEILAAGASVASRLELTEKPVPGMPSIGFSHVTLYGFAGDDAEARLDGVLARDRELTAAGRVHPNHSVIGVDALRAHGRFTERMAPAPELEGHIVAYVMCNQPARFAEWDAWYEATHLPDMMDSGAFAAGSRWVRRDPAPYGANHVTLYDIAGRSIASAVEASAAVMPGIAAAGRKLDCHVGAMTVTLRPSGRFGGAGLRLGNEPGAGS